jgi:hypothetical protein
VDAIGYINQWRAVQMMDLFVFVYAVQKLAAVRVDAANHK